MSYALLFLRISSVAENYVAELLMLTRSSYKISMLHKPSSVVLFDAI